jgi:hypothetical protein
MVGGLTEVGGSARIEALVAQARAQGPMNGRLPLLEAGDLRAADWMAPAARAHLEDPDWETAQRARRLLEAWIPEVPTLTSHAWPWGHEALLEQHLLDLDELLGDSRHLDRHLVPFAPETPLQVASIAAWGLLLAFEGVQAPGRNTALTRRLRWLRRRARGHLSRQRPLDGGALLSAEVLANAFVAVPSRLPFVDRLLQTRRHVERAAADVAEEAEALRSAGAASQAEALERLAAWSLGVLAGLERWWSVDLRWSASADPPWLPLSLAMLKQAAFTYEIDRSHPVYGRRPPPDLRPTHRGPWCCEACGARSRWRPPRSAGRWTPLHEWLRALRGRLVPAIPAHAPAWRRAWWGLQAEWSYRRDRIAPEHLSAFPPPIVRQVRRCTACGVAGRIFLASSPAGRRLQGVIGEKIPANLSTSSAG